MISIAHWIPFVTTRPAILGLEDIRVHTKVAISFYNDYFSPGAIGFNLRTGCMPTIWRASATRHQRKNHEDEKSPRL